MATLLDTEDEALRLCGLCFLDCLSSFESGVAACNVSLLEVSDAQQSTLHTLLSLFSRLHAVHFQSFIGPLYAPFASAVNYVAIPADFTSAAVTVDLVGDCLAAVSCYGLAFIRRREAAQQLTVKEWEMSAGFVAAVATLLRLNDVRGARWSKT